MFMSKILIDGRFLNLENAGLGRYSANLLKKIFSLKTGYEFILLARKGDVFDGELKATMSQSQDKIGILRADIEHYSIQEQLFLSKKIAKFKPDLVHFLHFNHPLNYKGKFIVTIHDLTLSRYAGTQNFIERFAYQKVMKSAIKKSVAICTVSNFVKSQIAKEYDVSPRKIFVTYNGVDEKFRLITNSRKLTEVEKEYHLKSPFILSVGQWRTHKNLARLVRAFSRLVKNEKFRDLNLVFVGKAEARDSQFMELVTKLGLEKKVIYTGFVEDAQLAAVYNLAELFVFPSLSEGFGLPGIEAQACGVPVISSNSTSLPEVLADGAIYFNPESEQEIVNSIERALEDKHLREQIRAAGIQNAKKYTWENCARSTLDIYEKMLYKEQN